MKKAEVMVAIAKCDGLSQEDRLKAIVRLADIPLEKNFDKAHFTIDSFTWEYTEEGEGFWEPIYDALEEQEKKEKQQ